MREANGVVQLIVHYISCSPHRARYYYLPHDYVKIGCIIVVKNVGRHERKREREIERDSTKTQNLFHISFLLVNEAALCLCVKIIIQLPFYRVRISILKL